MAVLGSIMPSLGLFLCLGMLFISASSANDSDRCMSFSEVIPTTGIMASSDVYEDNKVYTILVPVTYRTNSVVLRALDMNNNSIGFWYRADLTCNNSVVYFLKGTHEGSFHASWRSPSTNVTTVEIQAFAVNVQKMATFSSLKLKKQAMTATPSYSMISTTRPTTARILTTTQSLTTTRNLNPTSTPTTTKSLANRIFLSPITDAIQILLVFLTSKLLF
ncbi:placenta-expressed transcript 1 protein [Phyllostomus hastatus]|uniref:placenta-expressed transcript 1 protein n=1 Tax=Phyllostomus hastatus TaxID=9423 RepID=UPI001E6847C2|nr:placenta-expressed transcript 1 protein [Phyllostomus hastatus]